MQIKQKFYLRGFKDRSELAAINPRVLEILKTVSKSDFGKDSDRVNFIESYLSPVLLEIQEDLRQGRRLDESVENFLRDLIMNGFSSEVKEAILHVIGSIEFDYLERLLDNRIIDIQSAEIVKILLKRLENKGILTGKETDF
jgi:hypothetical protein